METAAAAATRTETVLRACLAEAAFEHVRLTVRGACMAPHAVDGARVRLVAAGRRAPRFGDVVLARTPAGLRLHRLVWPPWPARARRLRTMADRAICLDPGLPAGDVLAVALAVERDGRMAPPRRRATALRSLLRALATKLRHDLLRLRTEAA